METQWEQLLYASIEKKTELPIFWGRQIDHTLSAWVQGHLWPCQPSFPKIHVAMFSNLRDREWTEMFFHVFFRGGSSRSQQCNDLLEAFRTCDVSDSSGELARHRGKKAKTQILGGTVDG